MAQLTLTVNSTAPLTGVGDAPHAEIGSVWSFVRYISSGVKALTRDKTSGNYAEVDVSTSATDTTTNDVQFLPAVPTVGDEFILLFPTTRTLSGHDISVSVVLEDCTVGVQTLTEDQLWTNVSGLTVERVSGGAIVSADIFENTGVNFIRFTEPASYGLYNHENIVYRAMRFIVTAIGSAPVGPRVTQIFPLSVSPSGSDVTPYVAECSHPTVFAYASLNDFILFKSAEKPIGYRTIAHSAATNEVTSTVAYEYTIDGTSWNTLPFHMTMADQSDVADTVWTTTNTQSVTPRVLTATSAGGSAIAAEKFLTDGILKFTATSLTTATTERAGLGIAKLSTGALDFEMRKDFSGGNPRMVVYEAGVAVYTHDVNMETTDVYEIILIPKGNTQTRSVCFVINEIEVYESATVVADSAEFFVRSNHIDNSSNINEIRMTDLTDEVGVSMNPVFTGTNVTVTSSAPVSEFVQRWNTVVFESPTDWTALTIAQSPISEAGFHYRERISAQEGAITGATASNAVYFSANDVNGVVIATTEAFTRLASIIEDELSTDFTVIAVNKTLGTVSAITVPANTKVSNVAQAFTFTGGNEIALLQASGRIPAIGQDFNTQLLFSN